MTRHVYSEPGLICWDCDFFTYYEKKALTHAVDTSHSMYDWAAY